MSEDKKKKDGNFSIDECIMVLDLYRKLRNQTHSFDGRPETLELSERMKRLSIGNRTPKSIARKLDNFLWHDTNGEHGLKNGGFTTDNVWKLYSSNNFKELDDAVQDVLFRASELNPETSAGVIDLTSYEENMFTTATTLAGDYSDSEAAGYYRDVISRARVGQQIFRKLVLENFDERCCITGIGYREMLVASHIRPWAKCASPHDRVDVANGLCLNPLHDSAFDSGMFTLDKNLKVVLSPGIDSWIDQKTRRTYFDAYEEERISEPKHDLDERFLRYHRRYVFRKEEA